MLLKTLAQSSDELKNSQHNFKLAESFRVHKEHMPNPPSKIGLQALVQETVTNFLLAISPLQMKFLIQVSISFNNCFGKE